MPQQWLIFECRIFHRHRAMVSKQNNMPPNIQKFVSYIYPRSTSTSTSSSTNQTHPHLTTQDINQQLITVPVFLSPCGSTFSHSFNAPSKPSHIVCPRCTSHFPIIWYLRIGSVGRCRARHLQQPHTRSRAHLLSALLLEHLCLDEHCSWKAKSDVQHGLDGRYRNFVRRTKCWRSMYLKNRQHLSI
ncbi:hypothetical protein BDR07DRAFT_512745 [Suillus spraguei]|nr:hypothetical protein BDR07DRAFT_512745 [Suillus spraguei]